MPPLYRFIPVFWLALFGLGLAACNSTEPEPVLERTSEPVYDAALAPSSSYPGPTDQPLGGYPGFNQAVTIEPLPTLPPTPIPPPDCGFGLPTEVQAVEAPISGLSFSQPQIIATNSSGFAIAQWLPDNEHLLITENMPPREMISVLDINTGIIQPYAERQRLSGNPIWLEQENGVVFVDSTVEEGWVLRFAPGEEQPVQTLQEQLASVYLSLNPASQQVTALLPSDMDIPVSFNTSGQQNLLLAGEVKPELMAGPKSASSAYHLAWSSDGRYLLQHNGSDLTNYLLDTSTGIVCQIEMGEIPENGKRWIFYAKWSPDGEYLAMINAIGYSKSNPVRSELSLLDFNTNQIMIISPNFNPSLWQSGVTDFDWSPDSNFLILKAGVDSVDDQPTFGLFLLNVEALSGQRVLGTETFWGVGVSNNIAWSQDGSHIVFRCPTYDTGNICLVNVAE